MPITQASSQCTPDGPGLVDAQVELEEGVPNDAEILKKNDRQNSLSSIGVNESLPQQRQAPLLVVKVGTSTIMDPNTHTVSLSHLGKFVDTVCNLKAMGYQVVIVSSGAVGVGCVHLKLAKRPNKLSCKQAVAAVGQCRLMRIYEDLFSIREEITAQVLITRTDLVDRNRFSNFKKSLLELLALGVTPIINENDSVATECLRFGDNDTLAAYCAVSISASWLILLTDVHCLYTANPRVNSCAKAIAFVSRVAEAEKLLDTRTNAGSSWGSGGMETKIVSAKIATAAGIHTALAHGEYPERILDILAFAESNASPVPEPREEQVFPSKRLTCDFFNDERFSASATAAKAAAAAGNDGVLDTFIDMCNKTVACDGTQTVPSIQPPSAPHSYPPGLHPSPSRAELIQTAAGELLPTQHQLEQQLEIVQEIAGGAPYDGQQIVPELTVGQLVNQQSNGSPSVEVSTSATDTVFDLDGDIKHECLTNSYLAQRGIVAVDPVGAWQERLPYVGTIFVAQECTQKVRDKRRWILSLPVRGVVYVDEGCAKAVVVDKKSLFAAGIKDLEGHFTEGDVVAICQYQEPANPQIVCTEADDASLGNSSPSMAASDTSPRSVGGGEAQGRAVPIDNPSVNSYPNEIARCLINFPASELQKVKGLRSRGFQAVLGYNCDPEVAHRSNIIFVDTTLFREDEDIEF